MGLKVEYYCSTCYRWFKTLDHFTRYANRRLGSPCQPMGPVYRCVEHGKYYSKRGWAERHFAKYHQTQ
jgi:hypothetical protein